MTEISCSCGGFRARVIGTPIISVECCCTSCRTAAVRFEGLPGAPKVRTPMDTVPYVLYRKDRVEILTGAEKLQAHKLTPKSKTVRVVATCCNTPVYTEFRSGHWLSLFAGLWPEGKAPLPDLRTMAKDHPDPALLDARLPNAKTQSGGFMWKLLTSWIAMGFRVPKMPDMPELTLDLPPKP